MKYFFEIVSFVLILLLDILFVYQERRMNKLEAQLWEYKSLSYQNSEENYRKIRILSEDMDIVYTLLLQNGYILDEQSNEVR